MRPAFGSGEDWNRFGTVILANGFSLRPAFGSGEDWNFYTLDVPHVPRGCARPSGRARIGTSTVAGRCPPTTCGCARPSGRARIGTCRDPLAPLDHFPVAPGLRVGRGLEQPVPDEMAGDNRLRPAFGSGEDWNGIRGQPGPRRRVVAPGLRVGRGLEQVGDIPAGLPAVAPGLRVGRGLELVYQVQEEVGQAVAPGLRVGRGLELYVAAHERRQGAVAPGLRVGRGLEPVYSCQTPGSSGLRPAFGSGEDWNSPSLAV